MEKQSSKHSNFRVTGFTSIQIGGYIILSAYLIKSSLDGYILDGFSSSELNDNQIEFFIKTLVLLSFVFSTFTLWLKGMKTAKRNQIGLWNRKSKISALIYGIAFTVILVGLFLINQNELKTYLAPYFLFGFAVHNLLHRYQPIGALLVPGLCILLGIICTMIPSYWYASLLILGVAYITIGISKR